MTDEQKKLFTERLKSLETEARQIKLRLEFIEKQIEISQKYEDELTGRLALSRETSSNFRNQFFKTANELNETVKKMKNELEIYTGNYYSL